VLSTACDRVQPKVLILLQARERWRLNYKFTCEFCGKPVSVLFEIRAYHTKPAHYNFWKYDLVFSVMYQICKKDFGVGST